MHTWQIRGTSFSAAYILVSKTDIKHLTSATCVGCGGRERSAGSRHLEQGELSAGMRGEFLEEVRIIRH